MIHKPEAKSLRAASGMERMRRFANSAGALRMQAGGELPMNTIPMGAQDQGAFNGLQNTATGDPSAAPATAAPRAPSASRHAAAQSLLSAGNFKMEIPGLRNGGEIHAADGFFGNLRKAIMPTDAEKVAKQQYLDSTRAPTPAPTAPAPKAISSYAGNGALEGRMKAAGLRNGGDLRIGQGGHVPGSGSGDKIPAKYEPGEFVVSNDMLDAQPELRTHLRDLRENVLAQKGMTPEQADAKAMTGGGLRAANGAGPEAFKRIAGALAQPAAATPQVTGISQSVESLLRSPAQPFTNPAANPITLDMVEAHGNGRYGAPANPSTAAPTTPAAPAAPQSLAQRSMGKLRSVGNTVKAVGPAIVTGIAGSAAARYARGIGEGDSGPDGRPGSGAEQQIPTDGYPKAPTAQPYNFFTDNNTGRNIGNTINALPGVIGGGLPSQVLRAGSGAARAATAETIGLAAVGGASADIQDGRQATSAAPQTSAQPDQQSALQDAPAGVTGPQPGGNSIRVERQANGNLAFSGENISGTPNYIGPASGSLRGGANPINVMPGMSQDVIDRTLNNPDGSRWSAEDNAIMAANIRDGVDKYRGTSRQPAANKYAGLPIKTAAAMRVADIQAASSRENNAATNATAMYGHNLTSQTALRSAMRAQSNSDREFGLSREKQDQEIGTKRRESAMKEFRVADSKDPTKWDEVASQQSYDAVRQIFPKIDSASEKDRNEAMPDAKAMAKIFNRVRTQDKVGWDAMKFWESKRPVLNGMPDVAGTTAASVEQVGPFAGMVMLNGSYGDTILTQKDGRKLNLGILDARERKLLETAQQKGWGN